MDQPKFIASCSFGKDSIAALLLAKEHGEPLDEAVYCEVMFDEGISGEVPEHRDFIYHTAIPALERMGIKVVVLRSDKTYVGLFTGRVTRGPKKGMVRSFPICGKCAVQRDCKVRPIQRYQKTLPPGTVQYIGIAQDEQERLLRLEGGRQVSLLDKYNFTERDAWELCRKAGLLSPVYEFTDRGGCWFCPNAKRAELRHLYDYHPKGVPAGTQQGGSGGGRRSKRANAVFAARRKRSGADFATTRARMLELQAIPGKVSEKFNRRQTFAEIDELFRQEDAQAA